MAHKIIIFKWNTLQYCLHTPRKLVGFVVMECVVVMVMVRRKTEHGGESGFQNITIINCEVGVYIPLCTYMFLTIFAPAHLHVYLIQS